MKHPRFLAVRRSLGGAVLTPVLADAQLFTLTKEQLIDFTAQNPFERFADGRPEGARTR